MLLALFVFLNSAFVTDTESPHMTLTLWKKRHNPAVHHNKASTHILHCGQGCEVAYTYMKTQVELFGKLREKLDI